MGKPRVKVPKRAQNGEVVTLKAAIRHKMECGITTGANGEIINPDIIKRFTCKYNDEVVADVNLEAYVSEDPYFEFQAICAIVPGVFEFEWHDANGAVYTKTSNVKLG